MFGGTAVCLFGQFHVLRLTAIQPTERSLHSFARELGRRLPGHDMIEGHGDVGPQPPLDIDSPFRRESSHRAIDMTLKLHSVLRDASEPLKRENLEPARIGEHRASPGSEAVEPSHGAHDLFARPQMQVVGVAQNDLSAGTADVSRAEPSDHGVRAYRHERRGVHLAMRQGEGAGAGSSLRSLDVELKHQAGPRLMLERRRRQKSDRSGAGGPGRGLP